MQRYYFHLVSREVRHEDHDGRECASLSDACHYARRLIGLLLTHIGEHGPERSSVRVETSSGENRLVVLFPATELYPAGNTPSRNETPAPVRLAKAQAAYVNPLRQRSRQPRLT
jgi:hypothetical protein